MAKKKVTNLATLSAQEKWVLIDTIALILCFVLYIKKAISPIIAGLVMGGLITMLYMMMSHKMIIPERKWELPKRRK